MLAIYCHVLAVTHLTFSPHFILNSCLNWEGMGWRQRTNAQNTYSLPDVGLTNNNGMKATVELLEAIVTRLIFSRCFCMADNIFLFKRDR